MFLFDFKVFGVMNKPQKNRDLSKIDEKQINDILLFWFGKLSDDETFPAERAEKWFKGSKEFDQEIESLFAKVLDDAIEGKRDHWQETPKGTLALIVLLDQFSRNLLS